MNGEYFIGEGWCLRSPVEHPMRSFWCTSNSVGPALPPLSSKWEVLVPNMGLGMRLPARPTTYQQCRLSSVCLSKSLSTFLHSALCSKWLTLIDFCNGWPCRQRGVQGRLRNWEDAGWGIYSPRSLPGGPLWDRPRLRHLLGSFFIHLSLSLSGLWWPPSPLTFSVRVVSAAPWVAGFVVTFTYCFP